MNWRVIYKDGTELSQYNGDNSENKYTDIDRKKLSKFILEKNQSPVLIINFDENKRLIFRKRICVDLSGKTKDIVYLVGWQETINGKNIQMIAVVFQDGKIEIINKFEENHPWFYPIEFLPEELSNN